MKIIIELIPPSNNEFIGRAAIWEYRAIKKEWEALVRIACIGKPKKRFERARVYIHYCFPNHIRRDPDNYSGKMILDGLVKAGVLKDDSFDCVQLILSASVDPERPRTEITIQELDKT